MADNISEAMQNIRTMEDIVYLLTILFTNLNNQNELYYDMFLNPEPMDLQLERYDENGELETVTLPNRAKEKITAYSGTGNPNGQISAPVGALYVDNSTYNIYYKGYGADSQGWFQLISSSATYLTPDGDGSQLTNLNASSISLGTLSVARGGTGSNSLTGILKGNGTSPITTAQEGVDYMAPATLTGVICYYPIYDTSLENNGVPAGWLVCDGSIYNISDYPQLGNLLKNKHGGDGINTFAVPNYLDVYLKGSTTPNRDKINGTVGSHSHPFSGTTDEESSHTHGPGTLDAIGQVTNVGIGMDRWTTSKSGVLKSSTRGNNAPVQGGWDNNEGYFNGEMNFKLSDGWVAGSQTASGTAHSHPYSGITSTNAPSTVTNDVDHKGAVPIIKC